MDLGTNTFHLLIAEGTGSGPKEILHLYEPVKLGQGGINKGFIQPDAFERGISTMQKFNRHIRQHGIENIKAIATSTLRSTTNGKDFIEQVKQDTGLDIEVINGDREAVYIYQGVKASGCLRGNFDLIIDIGGGSVEFIICNEQELYWKQSFEIGAARLMDRFHQTDPIPALAVNALYDYLDGVLQPLFDITNKLQVDKLIGSSGAFETFAEVMELEKGRPFNLKSIRYMDLDETGFIRLTDRFITSDHQQRAATKGIIPLRVDMIVVASLLTRFILQRLGIHQIAMSMYSLKEGVLAEMLG